MTEVAGQTNQAYDTAGRLLWQASAMGVLETNQWDALGQLTQTKRLTNAIMQEDNYVYDKQGRITQLSDNRGRETRIAYDERGRPSLIADQSGRVMDLSAISTATATATTTPLTQQWREDFGRVVATRRYLKLRKVCRANLLANQPQRPEQLPSYQASTRKPEYRSHRLRKNSPDWKQDLNASHGIII